MLKCSKNSTSGYLHQGLQGVLSRSRLDSFQVDAVDSMVKGRGHFFLALDMGLGKTAVSIVALDELGEQKNILIVCAASHVGQWVSRLREGQQIPRTVGVYNRPESGLPQTDVVVSSMDRIKNWPPSAFKRTWSTIIVDEAHNFKCRMAQRTKALYGKRCDLAYPSSCVAGGCSRVWLLSGTPMPKDGMDMWTHFRALWPDKIGYRTYDSFERANFRVFGGFNNKRKMICPDEFKALLDSVLFRRTQLQVASHLPPLRVTQTSLLLSEGMQEIFNRLRQEFPAALVDIKTVGPGRSELRQLFGIAKADALAPMAASWCKATGKPLVVFYTHNAVRDLFRTVLGKAGISFSTLGGATPGNRRASIVDGFQRGDVQVMLGHIKVAGVGIDLTRSRDLWFAEHTYIPADSEQAIRRCLRLSSEGREPVNARFFCLKNTPDADITRMLAQRAANISKVFRSDINLELLGRRSGDKGRSSHV